MNDVVGAHAGARDAASPELGTSAPRGRISPSSGIADTSEPLCYNQVRLIDEIRPLGSCWRCSACLSCPGSCWRCSACLSCPCEGTFSVWPAFDGGVGVTFKAPAFARPFLPAAPCFSIPGGWRWRGPDALANSWQVNKKHSSLTVKAARMTAESRSTDDGVRGVELCYWFSFGPGASGGFAVPWVRLDFTQFAFEGRSL